MMSLWDALRMNMMISYQELVRTFLRLRLLIFSAKVTLPFNMHYAPETLAYRQLHLNFRS